MEKKSLLNPPEELEVPMSFYAAHRKLICENMRQHANAPPKSVILLKGIPTIARDDEGMFLLS